MNSKVFEMRREKWMVGGIFVGSIVANLILWFLCLVVFPRHSAAAVLHFTADTGIDFVGLGSNIMILPVVGGLLILFNVIMGLAVIKADKRAAWVLWSILPLLQGLLLLAFYFIWRANK